MTGRQVRERREALGVPTERFAEALGVPVATLTELEGAGRIPARLGERLARVLWEFASADALAESGLPECDAVRALLAADPPDERAVAHHLRRCPICHARAAYVHHRVGHAPRPPGLTGLAMRVVDLFGDGPAWLRSAMGGVAMVLTLVAAPIVICLASALIFRDHEYVGWAVVFSAVALVAGGCGGLVYAATARLRERGTVGHDVSWVLSVYSYIALTIAVVYEASFKLRVIPPQADVAAMARQPWEWAFLLVVGAIFGVIIGRSVDLGATTDPDTTTMGPFGSRRGLLVVFAVVTLLAGVGIQMIRLNVSPPKLHVDNGPSGAEREAQLALALRAQGRSAEALPHARRATRLAPRNAEYWATLGLIAYEARAFEEARAAYRRALGLDSSVVIGRPEHLRAWSAVSGAPATP